MMIAFELIIYILFNIFYFAKFSYSLYTDVYVYVNLYYPLEILVSIIISIIISYFRNHVFALKKTILSVVISLLIFFIINIILNFFYEDVVSHYYSSTDETVSDMFSFGTYSKSVGNIFEVKNKAMAKYKKFCYVVQGYDESFTADDTIVFPSKEFTCTVYKINTDMFIIYDWKNREIINSISKKTIEERAFVEFSKLGEVEKIKIYNCNVYGQLEGEEMMQLLYIVPRNGEFCLEFNTDRKNKLLE